MANADETTVKIRAYSGTAAREVAQSNLTEEQDNALELVKKTAQLQEAKGKLLEHLKTIEQLQGSLKLEQAKTAEMAKQIADLETRVKVSAAQEIQAKEFAELQTKAKKLPELEAKVKELTEALGKIAGIAASGKAG